MYGIHQPQISLILDAYNPLQSLLLVWQSLNNGLGDIHARFSALRKQQDNSNYYLIWTTHHWYHTDWIEKERYQIWIWNIKQSTIICTSQEPIQEKNPLARGNTWEAHWDMRHHVFHFKIELTKFSFLSQSYDQHLSIYKWMAIVFQM